MHTWFRILILLHITVGAIGLVSFWVPVVSRKGGVAHRRWGGVFSACLLAAGSIAVLMGLSTLVAPLETHPHLVGKHSAAWIRGMFGWMMLYLAIFTVSLIRHGVESVQNKGRHAVNREPRRVGLQVLTIIAALNCVLQGWLIGEPLPMAIPLVGIASGLTNLWFTYTAVPARLAYQLEHVKASVGAGISVYTAFFAFGAVRLMPEHAFNPLLWMTPLVVGLAIIIYHQERIRRTMRRGAAAPAPGSPVAGAS